MSNPTVRGRAVKRTGCVAAFGLVIAVAACSSRGGTLTVTWVAPTKNNDGSPLTNLSGYTVHYGTRPKTYTVTIEVEDPKATRCVVTGLKPGTYFFAVAANNTHGGQSPLSSEAHGTVK